MREIILDTETTGLDPKAGHRIVEIGCIELMNHMPTGTHFHRYLNPERDMPSEAAAVHGLTEAFLKDKPVFAEIAGELVDFLGDAQLVIHNADFDMAFLNAEFTRLGFPAIAAGRAVDTVTMARRKFPGQAVSLDALCQRFGVDNSKRTLHGALLDAQLLGEVYLELIGGRQASIDLMAGPAAPEHRSQRVFRPARPHAADEKELAAHRELLARLKSPIWTGAG
jgi:DNA polymerase-3 subunit epsilon